MKVTNTNLCKYVCRKCNNYIFYNEACQLIYEHVYPETGKSHYNKNVLDKTLTNNSKNSNKSNDNMTDNMKLCDNMYRQIYNNGLCGVSKQKNLFLNKDNVFNMLSFLNKGQIKCTKCNNINMWYMK
ncbi:conserved protein, unknown function [Hepatocystis sp. ex Piliocolobus tephrosceles]|nr:conserved protein, unknown function [Hepatocystis sp. ex Piliocolobus tephrosceles]